MSCIVKIKEASSSFTETEKRIADYFLKHTDEAVTLNAQQLADVTHTSASAMIRFSQKLGYKGLTAMKVELARNVSENQDDELFNVLIEQNDSIKTMVKKVQQISLRNINQTYSLLNLEYLSNAIKLLLKAKTIYLIGVGGSGVICNDFMQKLSRINRNVVYHDDLHVLSACIAHISQEDVLVAISYSGETRTINNIVKQAKKVNTPVLAITQYNVRSTLAKLANIALYTPIEEKELRLGAISSRNASLVLTDLLYYGVLKDNLDESKEDLLKTREFIREVDTQ